MNLRSPMLRPLTLLASVLPLSAAFAAPAPAPTPVAYIYVISNPGYTGGHIYGYSFSSAGKLTAITGSPYSAVGEHFAFTGKWFFGVAITPSKTKLATNSYSIASNGSLKHILTGTTPIVDGFYEIEEAILDHSGASLYTKLYGSDQHVFQTFKVDSTTGKLTAGTVSDAVGIAQGVTFSSNNQFVYGTDCDRQNFEIAGLMRMTSDGSLSSLGDVGGIPGGTMPANVYGVCPGGLVADASGHVVIQMDSIGEGNTQAQSQLAVYTADKFGKLTTKSTFQNMPKVKTQYDDLSISPTGTYLAESDAKGIHLFTLHGSAQVTPFKSTLLPGSTFYQTAWDKHQHMYAFSSDTHKLYIYNVSSSGFTLVAGSPFTLPAGGGMEILSK